MSVFLFRSRRSRRCAVAIAVPLWFAGVSLAACAESSDGAALTPDSSVIIPNEASGADADAASDAGDGDGDAAIVLPDVPCAVGNVCHVTTALTSGSISAIVGRSMSDVWAAGSLGLVIHWDGHVWTDIRSTEVPQVLTTMTSLALSAEWAYGVAGPWIVRRGLAPDSGHTIDTFIPYGLTSIVFLDNGHGYIGASEGSFAPPGTGGLLIDLFDFDGVGLAALPPPVVAANNAPMPMNVQALFAVPGDALWAVGQRGTIARYPLAGAEAGPGEGIVLPLANQNNLFAVWGQGDQVWAVGEAGTVIRVDGMTATEEASGTTKTLNAVFGFSKSDIWAAGDSGTLLHFDGNAWSRIPIQGYSGKLSTIWGASPDDLWIGGEGAMFHWGPLP